MSVLFSRRLETCVPRLSSLPGRTRTSTSRNRPGALVVIFLGTRSFGVGVVAVVLLPCCSWLEVCAINTIEVCFWAGEKKRNIQLEAFQACIACSAAGRITYKQAVKLSLQSWITLHMYASSIRCAQERSEVALARVGCSRYFSEHERRAYPPDTCLSYNVVHHRNRGRRASKRQQLEGIINRPTLPYPPPKHQNHPD